MAGMINKNSKAYIRRSKDSKKALKDVQNNLEAVLSSVTEVTEQSLNKLAEEIQKKSNEYAPLDTGDLRKSSYISNERNGDNYTVEIGYKADYAIFTHEIGPYKHPTTPGTDYKYLQRAATEIESEIPSIIANDVKGVTK